eukprot:1155635-Pelagomonas_calceolata.AAC.25
MLNCILTSGSSHNPNCPQSPACSLHFAPPSLLLPHRCPLTPLKGVITPLLAEGRQDYGNDDETKWPVAQGQKGSQDLSD